MKKWMLMTLVVLLGFSLFGCRQDDDTIVVASKPFTEQYIMAEMLVYLIETQTDYDAEHLSGIVGGTTNIHPAMLNGEIDLYPEYTGTGWLTVIKGEPIYEASPLFDAVSEAYMNDFNIKWFETYGFNNTYGLAIRTSIASERGIETFSDLAELGSDLNFASTPEFFEREDGYSALQSAYGMDFETTTEMAIALKYDAIENNEVDIITVFTTDARLNDPDLTVLEDDLNHYSPYFASTVVLQETLDQFPELNDVLLELVGLISNEAMREMNYEVEINNADPKDVAINFLEETGLVD
jgi:glycine betaine/choline ABC-type transport system substrate-binding protein